MKGTRDASTAPVISLGNVIVLKAGVESPVILVGWFLFSLSINCRVYLVNFVSYNLVSVC